MNYVKWLYANHRICIVKVVSKEIEEVDHSIKCASNAAMPSYQMAFAFYRIQILEASLSLYQ